MSWLMLIFGVSLLLIVIALGPFIWLAGSGALMLIFAYAAIVYDPIKPDP
jgi:hypothetical protein